jgi:pimeloyl-ACP methyl ester carboxylesterase
VDCGAAQGPAPDAAPDQRAASQYITAFRSRLFEKGVAAMGFDALFEKSFSRHVDLAIIPDAERAEYIAEWSQPGGLTAMLNWYRASKLMVPPPGVRLSLPDWVLGAFPTVEMPTLVIWGMQDKALLPVQLEGLDRLVTDLRIVRVPDAGHFVPWEKPAAVSAALLPFLAERSEASAAAT